MNDLYRVRPDDVDNEVRTPGQPVQVEAWLDYLEIRRNALIMELRGIDRQLVQYGRIRAETLSRRIR